MYAIPLYNFSVTSETFFSILTKTLDFLKYNFSQVVKFRVVSPDQTAPSGLICNLVCIDSSDLSVPVFEVIKNHAQLS